MKWVVIGAIPAIILFMWYYVPAWRRWREEIKRWEKEKLDIKVNKFVENNYDQAPVNKRTHREVVQDIWYDIGYTYEQGKKERILYKKKLEDMTLEELMGQKFDMSMVSPAEFSKIMHEKMSGGSNQKQKSPVVVRGGKAKLEIQPRKLKVIQPDSVTEIKEDIPPPKSVSNRQPKVISTTNKVMVEPERFCGTCKAFIPGTRFCREPWYPRHKAVKINTSACAHWLPRKIELPAMFKI